MALTLEPDKETTPTQPKPAAVKPVPKPGTLSLASAPQGGGFAVPPSTAPAPTIAAPAQPVDRLKLATDTFNSMAEASAPAYAAAQRDTVRNAAALGQIASGGLRTRTGQLQLERERDLDALRKDLTTKATEGSIADATTAYQQALASAQHRVSEDVARSGIGAENRRLDLAEREGDRSFGLEGERLQLAREGQQDQSAIARQRLALDEKLGLGGLDADARRIAIAEKQQAAEAAYQSGQLSLGERDAALRELAQAENMGLERERVGLERERVQLSREAQEIQNRVALGQLSIAEARQALDEKVQNGQLSIAEAKQALDELTQEQSNEREGQRLQLARDQLDQTAEQAGLDRNQRQQLAELADRTQNRQLDISSTQGQNSLLLELARIMGVKDSDIDPAFLEAVGRALGIAIPQNNNNNNNNSNNNTTSNTGGSGVSGTTGGGTGGESGDRPEEYF